MSESKQQVDAAVIDVIDRRLAEAKAQLSDYAELKQKLAAYETKERNSVLEQAGIVAIEDFRKLYDFDNVGDDEQAQKLIEQARTDRPYLFGEKKDESTTTALEAAFAKAKRTGRTADIVAYQKLKVEQQ